MMELRSCHCLRLCKRNESYGGTSKICYNSGFKNQTGLESSSNTMSFMLNGL